MTKLTPSQLAFLASASSRDDALAMRPSDFKPAAAAKAGAKLVELGLVREVREVRAKGDMPVWREDEQGRPYSLKILKAGRVAVQAMTPAQRQLRPRLARMRLTFRKRLERRRLELPRPARSAL